MALIMHPEFQLYEHKNQIYCSSIQIAETFDKRHDHVLRKIETINLPQNGDVAKFHSDNFQRSHYIDAKGEKRPMFLLTREAFDILVMGFTGEKALIYKIAYIKRFKMYEQFIKDYILARDEFAPFTQAIEDAHEEPKSYHYSNEIDMINRIVLGMSAKQFKELHGLPASVKSIRQFLKTSQAKAIRKLQSADIRLLYKGFAFQERKLELSNLYNNTLAIGG